MEGFLLLLSLKAGGQGLVTPPQCLLGHPTTQIVPSMSGNSPQAGIPPPAHRRELRALFPSHPLHELASHLGVVLWVHGWCSLELAEGSVPWHSAGCGPGERVLERWLTFSLLAFAQAVPPTWTVLQHEYLWP